MNERLAGKAILVTGGNTGIGRSIVERCLAEGAIVAVHGLDQAAVDSVVAELGDRAVGVAGDLENVDTPKRIVDEAVSQLGKLDGVVNNAAIVTRASFEETNASMFDQSMAINVRAPFLICQAAGPHLKASKGCVVNIGSINAHGGEGILSAYSVSKGALQTMSKNLAEIFAKQGVRFTHLNLGWILSDTEYARKIEDGLPEGWPDRLSRNDIPSGKMTRPEDVANVVAFWLSEDARPFSGTVMELEQYPFVGRNPTKDEDFEMGGSD